MVLQLSTADVHHPPAPAPACDIISDCVSVEPALPVPELSIIVPTRNEAENVLPLVERIRQAVTDLRYEIIFVDDSTDDTPERIRQCAASVDIPIRLIHRALSDRGDGLGGAVLKGLRASEATWISVMDGDLQHPPEVIPQMLAHGRQESADLVVGSRYCPNGSASSFAQARALASRGSTLAAKAVFPHRLAEVTDPMSGFFTLRRSAVDLDALQPNGFKILLEIIGRTPKLRIREVAFNFGERLNGESKASLREGWRLLSTMLHLRFGEGFQRFVQFGIVGATGLLINALALAFFGEALGIHYLIAAIAATQFSTGWNFLISERLVFSRVPSTTSVFHRASLFYLMNNVALVLRVPLLFLLADLIGINYLISNTLSLVVLMVARFLLADRLIWGTHPKTVASELVPVFAVASSKDEGELA